MDPRWSHSDLMALSPAWDAPIWTTCSLRRHPSPREAAVRLIVPRSTSRTKSPYERGHQAVAHQAVRQVRELQPHHAHPLPGDRTGFALGHHRLREVMPAIEQTCIRLGACAGEGLARVDSGVARVVPESGKKGRASFGNWPRRAWIRTEAGVTATV